MDPAAYVPGFGTPTVVRTTLSEGPAEVVAADEDAITYEGDPRSRIVILRFPSQEAVDEWYKSEDYQKALPLRLNCTSDNWAGVVKAFG